MGRRSICVRLSFRVLRVGTAQGVFVQSTTVPLMRLYRCRGTSSCFGVLIFHLGVKTQDYLSRFFTGESMHKSQ